MLTAGLGMLGADYRMLGADNFLPGAGCRMLDAKMSGKSGVKPLSRFSLTTSSWLPSGLFSCGFPGRK
jgi:hypothetical protein